MTTPKTPAQNRRRPDEPAPDLVAFLLFHAGLRFEYARLADALERCDPRDERRRAVVDEHLALLLRVLHHHHAEEDEAIWPLLRGLVPEAAPVLDRLEADHQEMDAVIGRLSAGGRPAGEVATDLRALDRLLNAHLDLEESEVVPLIREHVSAVWWDASAKKVIKSHGRDLPMLAAWLIDTATPADREHLLATVPVVMRVLYRLSWRRAYERRMSQVYG
ncbi:hemerythrin domain-containing protein [Microbispora cellulosiformans]|uniref:Hemerythrin domain-containing protein n=1 Tax=Microbispora cellulosiformans TaxID=2614688 RepID=A0A5J5K1Z1_9ACTN|nr:hemerythrin domain-containing protein [Microbispora cellulosiformans]KAA9378352.1 hemerythrin domain-containing protein [Microbispora cellulosiformans]